MISNFTFFFQLKLFFNSINRFFLFFIFFTALNILLLFFFFKQYDAILFKLHFCFFILSAFVFRYLFIEFDDKSVILDYNTSFLYYNITLLFFFFFLLFHNDILLLNNISFYFIKIDNILNPKMKFIFIIFSLSMFTFFCLKSKREIINKEVFYVENKYFERCYVILKKRINFLNKIVLDICLILSFLVFLLLLFLKISEQHPELFFLCTIIRFLIFFFMFLSFIISFFFFIIGFSFWFRIEKKLKTKYNNKKYNKVYKK